MVTYAFDASAALRFLDNEAGAERVAEIIRIHAQGDTRLVISAIQWGEIAGVLHRRHTTARISQSLVQLATLGLEVVPVSPDQAVSAAILRNTLKIPYADAFLVILTQALDQAILITADFDSKAAEHLVQIEFLPTRPVPNP